MRIKQETIETGDIIICSIVSVWLSHQLNCFKYSFLSQADGIQMRVRCFRTAYNGGKEK